MPSGNCSETVLKEMMCSHEKGLYSKYITLSYDAFENSEEKNALYAFTIGFQDFWWKESLSLANGYNNQILVLIICKGLIKKTKTHTKTNSENIKNPPLTHILDRKDHLNLP